MTRVIATAEVQKHKKKDSLWMIIHDDVYDVSKFIEEHPGGEDALLDNGGLNATEAFEDVGHSEDARELLKKYKIGTLPEEEKTSNNPAKTCPGCCLSCVSGSSKKSKKSWRSFDTPSSSELPSKGSAKAAGARFAVPLDQDDDFNPNACPKKIVCCKGTQAEIKPKKKERRGCTKRGGGAPCDMCGSGGRNWKLYALAAVVLGSIAVGVMAYKKYA